MPSPSGRARRAVLHAEEARTRLQQRTGERAKELAVNAELETFSYSGVGMIGARRCGRSDGTRPS